MAVHLVRHAKAGNRGDHHDDEARPLSKGGRAQADVLVEQLSDFPIKRIVSSRYVRCTETVVPLALALRGDVEEHGALAEGAAISDTWELIEQFLASDTDVVVCSHGNVLGAVLDRVRRRGVPIKAKQWSCAKGSVWRLETDNGGELTRAVLAFNPK